MSCAALLFALVIAAPDPQVVVVEKILREVGEAKADLLFARFTKEMAAAVPRDKTEELLAAVTHDRGAIVALEPLACGSS